MPSNRSNNPRAHAPKHAKASERRRSSTGYTVLGVLIILAVILVVATTRGGHKTTSATSKAKTSSSSKSSAPKSKGTTGTGLSPKAWVASLEAKVKGQPGHLAPGSNPSVLPGPIMIADRNNSRLLMIDPKGRIIWQYPAKGNLAPGQTFVEPDDAFFGPNGKHILATQESQFVITEILAQTGKITWRYGHPGTSGSSSGYLNNPDDAMILPNGNILSADIKNCRLLYLSPSVQSPVHVYGETTPYCYHQPPARFGSPNGMFPMTNGNWLVTEINGDWVDEMTPSGQIKFSVHPPGITYPSDSNEVSPGLYLTAAYTKPGVIEEFNQSGNLVWRFAPTGANALNQPSIALPLPNGDILATDDWNHRVIVIDPKTNKIVWQYGHTGVPGTKPGYLDKPDGVDLAPPYSLLMTHKSTIGIPPYPVSAAATASSAPAPSAGG